MKNLYNKLCGIVLICALLTYNGLADSNKTELESLLDELTISSQKTASPNAEVSAGGNITGGTTCLPENSSNHSSPANAAAIDKPNSHPIMEYTIYPAESGGAAMDDSATAECSDPADRSSVRASKSSTNQMSAAISRDSAVMRNLKMEEVNTKDLAQQKDVQLQEKETQGLKSFNLGLNALKQQEYEKSLQNFDLALQQIPSRDGNETIRTRAKQGASEASYALARKYSADKGGDLAKARKYAERSLEYVPTNVAAELVLNKIIMETEKGPTFAEKLELAQKGGAPLNQQEKRLSELTAEGRRCFAAGAYDEAEEVFERIVMADPYNSEAMRYLKIIADYKYDARSNERNVTDARMMADVRQKWNSPLVDGVFIPRSSCGAPSNETKIDSNKLLAKMEKIILPAIEFRQTSVQDVIAYMVDASQSQDPEGSGINVVLKLNETEVARNVSGDEAGFAPGMNADAEIGAAQTNSGQNEGMLIAKGTKAPDIPLITLNMRRVTMLDALKIITELAGLRYRIEGNVVIITPVSCLVGPVVTRLYPVQPSIVEVFFEPKDNKADPRPGTDYVGLESGLRARNGDIKQFFEKAGVPFPAGTSITYNPAVSQLIVANTAENLEVFEKILSQLNVVPQQVEIEARFIEVGEDDIEELGFEWMLRDKWELVRKKDGKGHDKGVQVDANKKGITQGERFFSQGKTGVEPDSQISALGPALGNILSFSSVLTNPELSVILHALSQHGGTDLLSAPKVTTRSGLQANIKVVKEIIYPTDFTVTPGQVTAGGVGPNVVTPTTVTPGNFKTREVGVILNVTPTVGPDGYTINLVMLPEVSELVDWIQYGGQNKNNNFSVPQPVFNCRSLATSIVIWDGQTVVMGGLISEQMVKVHDRVPGLSKVPLLGRLFRSDGEYSKKKNLLIFVTARLVDPAGRPIHKPGELPNQHAAPKAAEIINGEENI